jgi:iron complex outermembrane receptor protein
VIQVLKKSLFILLFGFLLSQEGSVTGIIMDENKKIIEGADVYFQDLSLGSNSDSEGKFLIRNLPLGENSLTISMIGYEKVEKNIVLYDENLQIGELYLKRDTLSIKEIIVDSHNKMEPISFASNIDFIGDEYHKNLKTTLAQLLENRVGLSIQSMGQAVGQPVLRGYKSDRFLLTEDGVSIGDLSNTSIDHAVSVDMASYKKIKIIRGPEALLYGSNTIGGVIDVSREAGDNPIFDHFSYQSVLGTESSNNSKYVNIITYLPINIRNQFRFSALKRETGNQTSPNKTLANTGLSNNELTGSYSYFGKTNQFIISFDKINMDYGIPGSLEGHIDGVDIRMTKWSQKLNYHKDLKYAGFERLDIDQRYISYSHSEYENGNDYSTVSLGQNIFSIQSILSNDHMKIGSSFQYRDYKAGGFYWTPDTEEIKTAIFGLYEKKIFKTIFQFSSRIEHLFIKPEKSFLFLSNIEEDQVTNRNYTIFSGAVGGYKNWNKWKLSFGGMLTSRAPSVDHLFSDGPHLGTYSYEIGEPNLKVENTLGLESSMEYIAEKSDIRFTLYHNYSPNYHISTALGNEYVTGADYIEWGSGSAGWLYKYQMKGLETRIYGFETEIDYQLTKKINIFTSLSISRGENLSDEIPLSYMPPDKFIFSSEINLNPLKIDLIYKQALKQSRLGEFETSTNGYKIIDLNTSFSRNSNKLMHKFILGIENILNQEYYNHLSRIKLVMPEKGRSLNMQYRLIF